MSVYLNVFKSTPVSSVCIYLYIISNPITSCFPVLRVSSVYTGAGIGKNPRTWYLGVYPIAPLSFNKVFNSVTRELYCVVYLDKLFVSLFIVFCIVSLFDALDSVVSVSLFVAIFFLKSSILDFVDTISDTMFLYVSVSRVAFNCVFICTTLKSAAFGAGVLGVLPLNAYIVFCFAFAIHSLPISNMYFG